MSRHIHFDLVGVEGGVASHPAGGLDVLPPTGRMRLLRGARGDEGVVVPGVITQ
jgi:hypothetical protein